MKDKLNLCIFILFLFLGNTIFCLKISPYYNINSKQSYLNNTLHISDTNSIDIDNYMVNEVSNKINTYVEFLKYNNQYNKLLLPKLNVISTKEASTIFNNTIIDNFTIDAYNENNSSNQIYVKEKELPEFLDNIKNQSSLLNNHNNELIKKYEQSLIELRKEKAKFESEIQINSIEKQMSESENDYFLNILKKSNTTNSFNLSKYNEEYDRINNYFDNSINNITEFRLLLHSITNNLESKELSVDVNLNISSSDISKSGDYNDQSNDFKSKFLNLLSDIYDKEKSERKLKLTSNYIENYISYNSTYSNIIKQLNVFNNKLNNKIVSQKDKLNEVSEFDGKICEKNKKLLSLIDNLNHSIDNLNNLKTNYKEELNKIISRINEQIVKNKHLEVSLEKKRKEFSSIKRRFEKKVNKYEDLYIEENKKNELKKKILSLDNKITKLIELEESIFSN